MSESKKRSPTNDRNNNTGGRKRNLPSWMSDREDASASASRSTVVTKPMEGVIFMLSGFVNPERGMLRSQALEMGAEYQQDWNSSCTLLVCAFPNTPKFRQVEADSGTIVSKEWISECYKQRKLVEIEPYLMHAGKPWKKQNTAPGTKQDEQSPSKEVQKRVEKNSNSKDQQSPSKEVQKRVEKSSNSKPSCSAASKDVASDSVNDSFSPSKVKEWAVDDFKKTLSWLECQDEKPETSEIQKIAAEGILTCLQDTVDTLKQGQSIQQIAEQWACLPRVVEELAKLDSASRNDTASVSTEYLCKHAMNCKRIYELQYSRMGEKTSPVKNPETRGRGKGGNEEKAVSRNKADYDSDETIEMTEDEIDKAFDTITSTFADTG